MGRLFDIDNPVMRFLSRMADLMILNLLVLFTSIPIITIGASMTAMHYVLLKMARNEECYIVKPFFKSFIQNFKQATIEWLIIMGVGIIFFLDFYLVLTGAIVVPAVVTMALLGVVAVVVMGFMYVFPLQCRFENQVKTTMKNAFLLMVANFPKSILALVLAVIPFVLLFTALFFLPLIAMFGISLPAFAFAKMYSKVFKKLEPASVNEIADDYSFSIDPVSEEEQPDEQEQN